MVANVHEDSEEALGHLALLLEKSQVVGVQARILEDRVDEEAPEQGGEGDDVDVLGGDGVVQIGHDADRDGRALDVLAVERERNAILEARLEGLRGREVGIH